MKISIDRGYLNIVIFAVGSIAIAVGGAWLATYNEKLACIIALIILLVLVIRPIFKIERNDKNE